MSSVEHAQQPSPQGPNASTPQHAEAAANAAASAAPHEARLHQLAARLERLQASLDLWGQSAETSLTPDHPQGRGNSSVAMLIGIFLFFGGVAAGLFYRPEPALEPPLVWQQPPAASTEPVVGLTTQPEADELASSREPDVTVHPASASFPEHLDASPAPEPAAAPAAPAPLAQPGAAPAPVIIAPLPMPSTLAYAPAPAQVARTPRAPAAPPDTEPAPVSDSAPSAGASAPDTDAAADPEPSAPGDTADAEPHPDSMPEPSTTASSHRMVHPIGGYFGI
ncbi:MAG: hypothetical protein HYY15_01710 [Candidatus Omnitrophica bacterium]|nr:hypothetical protein [Candidatus Omnitrophota bacterium]